jgi:histone H4
MAEEGMASDIIDAVPAVKLDDGIMMFDGSYYTYDLDNQNDVDQMRPFTLGFVTSPRASPGVRMFFQRDIVNSQRDKFNVTSDGTNDISEEAEEQWFSENCLYKAIPVIVVPGGNGLVTLHNGERLGGSVRIKNFVDVLFAEHGVLGYVVFNAQSKDGTVEFVGRENLNDQIFYSLIGAISDQRFDEFVDRINFSHFGYDSEQPAEVIPVLITGPNEYYDPVNDKVYRADTLLDFVAQTFQAEFPVGSTHWVVEFQENKSRAILTGAKEWPFDKNTFYIHGDTEVENRIAQKKDEIWGRPAAAQKKQAAPPPAGQKKQAAPPPAGQKKQAAPPPAAQKKQAAPPPAAPKKQAAPPPAAPKKQAAAKPSGPRLPVSRRGVQEGVTVAAVRKLCMRAGIRRTSADITEAARIASLLFLERAIKDAVAYVDHARRKTVMPADVVHALKVGGRTIYGFK